MSRNGKKEGIHIDRRRFLKGIAATGAMGAIVAANSASASAVQSISENKSATKSWRDKPDPIDEALISDGGTYDVVVVGGGNSGLLCARAASMKGASVAVIENQAENGYVRGIGSQCGTINSQYALSQGAPRIDESDYLREWARRNVIRHDPKRASYFVKNSGKIFDWLISIADKEWLAQACHVMSCPPRPDVLLEVSGWKFYYGAATFRGSAPGGASSAGSMPDRSGKASGNTSVASDAGGMPGGAGGAPGDASRSGGMPARGSGGPSSSNQPWPELLKMHQEKAMADGAKWFNGHHAEICDVDASGAVTGVITKRADGKYVRFKARKGVALCAGDFGGNQEMVIDILDQVRHEAEARGDLSLVRTSGGMGSVRDGTGIKLGIWAGGHIEIGPRSCITGGDPGAGVWFLQLDHNGERFHDEASGTVLQQPIGSVRVTLYDANWKKAVGMMPPRHMAPDTSSRGDLAQRLMHLDNLKSGPIVKVQQGGRMGGGMSGLPGVEGGATCCANTIEELLGYMDCYKGETRKKALAEIERYNKLCEKGVDEDFGKDSHVLKVTTLKDPLLYATVGTFNGPGMFGLGAGMNATTGLDTDADGHVLDSNFKPIKGLYAAGNNAGGRYITVYQSPIAGISIGMAVTEGYMLGERLAEI
jgi:fumarate reductase flavoprotein subunit